MIIEGVGCGRQGQISQRVIELLEANLLSFVRFKGPAQAELGWGTL